MTFTTFYIMTAFISLFILVLFVNFRIAKDTACRNNPRCYSTTRITYFDIIALTIAAVIPFVNIVLYIIVVAIFLKDTFDIPVVKVG